MKMKEDMQNKVQGFLTENKHKEKKKPSIDQVYLLQQGRLERHFSGSILYFTNLPFGLA